jgi:hypothetical protein
MRLLKMLQWTSQQILNAHPQYRPTQKGYRCPQPILDWMLRPQMRPTSQLQSLQG